MKQFKSFGSFTVTREQHEQFKEGSLWQEWLEKYSYLFDENDKENAVRHASRGYYFHEWLAAILIFHSTGFLSLVDHYQYTPHARKNGIFKRLVGESVAAIARKSATYCPDLLVYKANFSDWYFVEVKGPSDRLRDNQIDFFEKLEEMTQKPIYLLSFTTQ